MKRLNNRGFTLVEVLATLAILIVIMSIAIPSISSSLERSKDKQNESRVEVLEAYAELYVADNKNTIYQNLKTNSVDYCYIELTELGEYASEGELEDSDGNRLSGGIVFSKLDNAYQYTTKDGGTYCYYSDDGVCEQQVNIACK